MTNTERIAENVRAELGRKGSKMVDVAGALEITTETLRAKRNGSSPFSIDEIAILANYLDIPFTTLIEGAEGYSKSDNQFTDIT